MALLLATVVCFVLCASAIGGEPSSDVTVPGAPVMAVREKRFATSYYKCPWGMVQTLWGCVPAGRDSKRPDSSVFDTPHTHFPRITRTRRVVRRQNKLGY